MTTPTIGAVTQDATVGGGNSWARGVIVQFRDEVQPGNMLPITCESKEHRAKIANALRIALGDLFSHEQRRQQDVTTRVAIDRTDEVTLYLRKIVGYTPKVTRTRSEPAAV